MMRFAFLGSGSEGNSLLIESQEGTTTTRVLLDCGFGIRETARRLERLGEELDGGDRSKRGIRADRDRPITGTRLLREWQGVEQIVTVTADGFEWQGRPYKSLSAIARAITGARWNGWTFFGLKNHRGRR